MLEAMTQGLGMLFTPITFLCILIGSLIGVVVGVTPILGGITAMGLLMPIVILGWPPLISLGFFVAMLAVNETGGAITSILINIPGTGINVATLIDGFPMTQKGEASRALGAALTSSVFSGVIAAVLAIGMIFVVNPIVLAFRLGEVTILILMAMTFISAMTGSSINKGLIAAFAGLLLSLVGMQLSSATDRWSFGSTYLYEGLPMIVVSVGMFGLGSLFQEILKKRKSLATGPAKTRFKDLLPGMMDVWHHRWMALRCMVVGYIVGVIPAAGGQVATFAAYGHAKQTSKHPELFGTGTVEGVIAPESANNACRSGDLLVTMAFGIPGSPAMAVLMVAMYAVGVVPGPQMLKENLPLAFALLWGIGIANIIGVIYCLAATPLLAKVVYIPMAYIAPAVLILVFIGAYVIDLEMIGMIWTLLFGVIGLVMMRLNYPRPAFILGFILGSIFEHNLVLAIQLQGPFFWTSPISLTMLGIIVFIFVWPLIKKMRQAGRVAHT